MMPIIYSSSSARYFARYMADIAGGEYIDINRLSCKKFHKRDVFIVGFYEPENNIWNSIKFRRAIIIFAGVDIKHLEEMRYKDRNDFFLKLRRKGAIFASEGEVIREKIQRGFGLDTRVVYLPTRLDFSVLHPFPEIGYHIGCYVPIKLCQYYNIDLIISVAKKMPDVTFHVYGINGTSDSWNSDIKNMICYKETVEDMPGFIKNMNCGLRVTKHDTYSMSAIEYNMAGRWFINNHSMPNCDKVSHIPTSEEIISTINSIRNRTGMNIDGRSHYMQRHTKEVFIERVNGIYSW